MFSYPFIKAFIDFIPNFLNQEIIYITDGKNYLLTENISISGRDIVIDTKVTLTELEVMDHVIDLLMRVIDKHHKYELLPDVKKYIDIMEKFKRNKIVEMITRMKLN